MLLVYADTSALFAYFHPRDHFSDLVDAAVRLEAPDFVYWGFTRFELRHSLRQTRGNPHGETAWKALCAAERTQSRLQWQSDLKCESLLESADELSAQHARESTGGAADFLHIAAAKRMMFIHGIAEFWTCDKGQSEAASLALLPVRLFELKNPPAQASA